jgi:NitT/TauT family transport system permease protein
MRGGIGRMLIQLAGQGSSDPAAPWGPTFGSILLGLVAAGAIAVLGLTLRNYRRGEATS